MLSGLLVLTLNLTCKGFVMDVVGIEITREGEGWCATVPTSTVHCWWRRLGLQGRKKAGCGALPAAGQEGRVFLLISCLIRLIHLLI